MIVSDLITDIFKFRTLIKNIFNITFEEYLVTDRTNIFVDGCVFYKNCHHLVMRVNFTEDKIYIPHCLSFDSGLLIPSMYEDSKHVTGRWDEYQTIKGISEENIILAYKMLVKMYKHAIEKLKIEELDVDFV